MILNRELLGAAAVSDLLDTCTTMCGDRFHTRPCTRLDVRTRGSTIEEVNVGKRILMMTAEES